MFYRTPDLRPSDLIRVHPWVGAIRQAASNGHDVEDPYRLAAIGLRESEMGWARGYNPKGNPDGWGDDPDGEGGKLGYGYGYFQIDRRYHRAFLMRPDCKQLAVQAQYACEVLWRARTWLRNSIREPRLLEAATFAAYNAGPRNVLRAIKNGGDQSLEALMRLADSVTTGDDYSYWVFTKADNLRRADPLLF